MGMEKKKRMSHTNNRGAKMNPKKYTPNDENTVSDEKIEEAVNMVIKDFSEDLIALGNE